MVSPPGLSSCLPIPWGPGALMDEAMMRMGDNAAAGGLGCRPMAGATGRASVVGAAGGADGAVGGAAAGSRDAGSSCDSARKEAISEMVG